jgi:hypothetical protein
MFRNISKQVHHVTPAYLLGCTLSNNKKTKLSLLFCFCFHRINILKSKKRIVDK